MYCVPDIVLTAGDLARKPKTKKTKQKHVIVFVELSSMQKHQHGGGYCLQRLEDLTYRSALKT